MCCYIDSSLVDFQVSIPGREQPSELIYMKYSRDIHGIISRRYDCQGYGSVGTASSICQRTSSIFHASFQMAAAVKQRRCVCTDALEVPCICTMHRHCSHLDRVVFLSQLCAFQFHSNVSLWIMGPLFVHFSIRN